MVEKTKVINTKLYIENYLKIKTKDSEAVPLKNWHTAQLKVYETIAECAKNKRPARLIILKARQLGISTITEAIIFKKTATKKHVNSAIIAHKEEATTNLFNMFKFYKDNLPDALRPQTLASNAKEVIFNTKDNKGLNSKIKCMTANSGGVGRSDTIHNLHISEYAFWPNNKVETLTGLLQAVPNTPDSLVIIESTANGFDEFKTLWDKAVNGDNDFIPLFFPWYDMPNYREPYNGFELTKEEEELKTKFNLDNEQLAWRRWCIANNCSGEVDIFNQEYPATPEDAFIASGRCIFDTTKINERLKQVEPPIKRGQFEYDYDGLTIYNIRWKDDPKGCISIYKDIKKNYPYVIGGDTSGEGSDFFIGQVIDNTTGEQVAILRHQFDEDLYARQMYCLGKYYNNALIGVETNFSTYPQKELQRLKYLNLYVREVEDTFTGRTSEQFGFKTTTLTRPIILANLVEIFRENINLINDRTTLNEALTFIKNEKGKPEAEQGKHDDTIIALAITYYIRTQQFYSPTKMVENKAQNILQYLGFKNTVQTKGGYAGWEND